MAGMQGGMPVSYVVLCEDLTVQSASNGTAQTYIITPKQYWGLGLNLSDFICGLRIKSSGDSNAGAGVTLTWQWSLDGKTWKTGTTVISEKTTADDYTGSHAVTSEQTPFVRLLASVRDTGTTIQKSSLISVWGYYRFRT